MGGHGEGQAPLEHPPTVSQHARQRGGESDRTGVWGLERVMSGVHDARSCVPSAFAIFEISENHATVACPDPRQI